MPDKTEQTIYLLHKIESTLTRIITNSANISSHEYYALSPSGMEKLESTCMLLIALGESIRVLTNFRKNSCYANIRKWIGRELWE